MKRLIILLLCAAITASCTVTASASENEPAYAIPDDIAETGSLPDLMPIGSDSQVPRIEITTENGNGASLLKSDGYVNAQISITEPDNTAISGNVQLKVRGNSTAIDSIAKKAFTFKFEKKTDVLGMGKAKKWALLANCFDPTLLRNYLIFDLAQKLGLPYTSEQRFAELWLDGAYRGCYTVYEPIQAGTSRVDIDTEEGDGKQDFMLELEASRVEDDVTYITVGGLRFAVSEPDPPTDDQTSYITDTMTDIVNTLKTGNEKAIRQKLDIDSFAKYYLLNEYAKTADFGYSSVFFFCKNGKLYAGPPWDYDLALGNLNGNLNSTAAKQGSVSDGIMQADKNFYRWLIRKEWFLNEVKRVYARHYKDFMSVSADGGTADSLLAQYKPVFDRNFSVWRVGRWWLNYQRVPFNTYDENYQLLKDWCAERNCWLTEYYGLYSYDYLLGDADGNASVEITDATVIQRVLAQLQEDVDRRIALRAALSCESLTITDVTVLQRYLAGLPVDLPINTPQSAMVY